MFPRTLRARLCRAWLSAQGRAYLVYGRHVNKVQCVEPGEDDISISDEGMFGYVGVN
jgi:hypothetical protein